MQFQIGFKTRCDVVNQMISPDFVIRDKPLKGD
jgi:hypothetical protein